MGPPPSAEGASDRELWRLAGRGDTAAFGHLFDRHATAVYNHLFRRTANWSEAEDLTSAVFLQVWRGRAKVVIDRDSALPWLLGVANHVLRNHQRASRRYRAALRRIAPAGLGLVSVSVRQDASSGHVIQASAHVGPVTVTGG
jgi:DNA-directed RNA polymerase specialized sigma24 family protein